MPSKRGRRANLVSACAIAVMAGLWLSGCNNCRDGDCDDDDDDGGGGGNAALRLISTSSSGLSGDGDSANPAISESGRYVVFQSAAENLVSGDRNGFIDIFIHDRESGDTALVSVLGESVVANGDSSNPTVSADGRYVAFESAASNLVPTDSNDLVDVFVRDRETASTEIISVFGDSTPGNGASTRAAISGNGRYVAFESAASNLVNNDGNGVDDIFIRDRDTDTTEILSLSSIVPDASVPARGNGPSTRATISTDARFVAFQSAANNLVSNDLNGFEDVFVRDRELGVTQRMSVLPNTVQGDGPSTRPSISADGRYIAFQSEAGNFSSADNNGIVDVFVRDRTAGGLEFVSVSDDDLVGNGPSTRPSISGDGNIVAFQSTADNLVDLEDNGLDNIYRRDRGAASIAIISTASGSRSANGTSSSPSISSSGRVTAFVSSADDLVSDDDNTFDDIFVHVQSD